MKKRFLSVLVASSCFLHAQDLSLGAEYLCLWMKNSPNPVAFVANFDSSPPSLSDIHIPNAKVIIGEESVSTNIHSGARFSCSYLATNRFGIEGSYLLLPETSKKQTVSSSGSNTSPFLLIPFFDVTLNQQSSSDLSLPGTYGGSADFKIKNSMQSAEALFFAKAYQDRCWNLRVLTGFKWWYFKEQLTLHTSSQGIPPPPVLSQFTQDSFKTKNNFYGGLIGLSADWNYGKFSLEMAGKLSLGSLGSELFISGSSTTNQVTGDEENYAGGYFALPTNMGHFHTHCFAILPEADAKLFFQLTKWAKLQIGYLFLYVNQALWAGNTVNPNINPTQAPVISGAPPELSGPAEPTPLLAKESFYIQGLTAGVQFNY